MEKRYQVFVSSTLVDLREERRRFIQSLLELDCFPAGMELFQASDEDQWSLIKDVIDDCDYYLVIIGGRYGSMKDGVSYTETEYDYAVQRGKPVLGFVHENPKSLKVELTDDDPKKAKKLAAFRSKAMDKMCRMWETPDGLAAAVVSSVSKMKKLRPDGGWVKAKYVSDPQTVLSLKNEIEKLKNASSQKPEGAENLSQGDDTVELACEVTIRYYDAKNREDEVFDHVVAFTWNEIVRTLGPSLMHNGTGSELKRRINVKAIELIDFRLNRKKVRPYEVEITAEAFETVLLQLVALGIIQKLHGSASYGVGSTAWRLTPYGNTLTMQLKAVRRIPNLPS